jgi:alkanesulfonate monooxygenase SsuD/methylene tetrahydromethanopterin reductase-like flavin-dependent oxidoreductase (luciferase family)
MLRDISEQVRLANDLGYDSVSFTEHHFHIEGFEVSNNPVLLDLSFAMQTRRIRRGDGMGILRDVIIADTDAEAIDLWRDSGMFAGHAWFEPFGFRKRRDDSRHSRARRYAPDALCQSAKPHTVDLSVCYQLPVNHSRSA